MRRVFLGISAAAVLAAGGAAAQVALDAAHPKAIAGPAQSERESPAGIRTERMCPP